MPVRLSKIPLSKNLLTHLANHLADSLPGAQDGDFSRALVILPSSRACKKLGHVLLENSSHSTLLLPRILTPAQLSSEVIAGLGLSAGSLPDPRIRPIILAHHLKDLPWLQDRPESAPGLATEYVKFFDEVRLYGKDDQLFDGANIDAVLSLASDAEAHIVASDLARIQEVWQLYRSIIPVDETDETVSLAEALTLDPTMPLAPADLVLVAGIGRMDPMRQTLLQATLNHGTNGTLYLPESTSKLSRLFCTTWDPQHSSTDPLAGSRSIAAQFGLNDDDLPASDQGSETLLRARIEKLGVGMEFVHPQGPIQRLVCGDPENESRLVAHRIVEILQGTDGNKQHIAVAVNDVNLASRIGAQLRAAGVDSDSSHGSSLSTLPAGLLLRFILRSALMDLRSEPLLEVLAHPYVSLELGGDSHGLWTLRLEKMFRRTGGPQGGLTGMHRQAAHRDAAALRLFEKNSPGMGKFVTAIADAFEPLVPFSDRKTHGWPDLLTAVTNVWNNLSKATPLQENKEKSDVSAVAKLLKVLQDHAAKLPPVSLAGFASDLGRLLSAESVPTHRQGNLPIQILGMVEARLEFFDHLILAGLREGSFPAKPERPVLLNGRLRKRLGLPRWQDALARDAELFLRLLHNAPNVLLTRSKEDGGKPCLASPFILRLDLCLGEDLSPPVSPADIPLWRKQAIALDEFQSVQSDFSRESRIIEGYAPSRPQTQLSWSGLRLWRNCPYSFHLQRGLALRQEEEVAQEFSKQENGTLIHAALKDFLIPNGPGWDALHKGNAADAEAFLDTAAQEHFGPGSNEMPVRLLWLKSFRLLIPSIINLELARAKSWKPVLLEESFNLSLVDLEQWVLDRARRDSITINMPVMADHARLVTLRGAIDRVDVSLETPGVYSVLDYKTGKIPSAKDVQELKDMQLHLYAIALECGATDPPVQDAEAQQAFFYSVTKDKVGQVRKKVELDCADGSGSTAMVMAGVELIRLASEAADPQAKYPLLPEEFSGDAGAGLPCRYCEYRGICRLEERDLGPVTGNKIDAMVNRKKVV